MSRLARISHHCSRSEGRSRRIAASDLLRDGMASRRRSSLRCICACLLRYTLSWLQPASTQHILLWIPRLWKRGARTGEKSGLACLALAVSLILLFAAPTHAVEIEELQKIFIGPGDMKARVDAGLQLARRDPDALAKAMDKVVKEGVEGDAGLLATVAVRTKQRHIRLLLTYGASKFKGQAGKAFLDKVDNDYPQETIRALESLGFLRDHAAYDRVAGLLRNKNELIAIQAARALARIGLSKDVPSLVKLALEVDNGHVRLHLTWAVQDMMRSKKKAGSAFGKYMGKRGTIGFRAKEAVAMIDDELTPVEKYKVKLDEARKFFNPRGGVKPPPIKAPDEQKKLLLAGFEGLKKNSPAWYHYVCTSIKMIEVSGSLDLFEFKRGLVKLRFADLIKWDRPELVEYYLVRYAGIMYLARMGDPTEGHRGWEEGMMDGWTYAMDFTKIAVEEDPVKFLKGRIRARPW